MKYDVYNAELTVDNLNLVNYDCIRSWIDAHIDIVLSDLAPFSRNYLTGDIDLCITIICYDYVVAYYRLSSDSFHIQSVGYNRAKEVI